MKKEYTKEQIAQYREDVIAELQKLAVYAGKNPANYDAEIEQVKNYPDDVIVNAMMFNSPAAYAEMLTM